MTGGLDPLGVAGEREERLGLVGDRVEELVPGEGTFLAKLGEVGHPIVERSMPEQGIDELEP